MSTAEFASSALEQVRHVRTQLAKSKDIVALADALRKREPATVDGVWGSSSALLAAALAAHQPPGLVVVCPQAEDVDRCADDMALFQGGDVVRFPAWESEPGERMIHDDIFGDRLRTLKTLLQTAGEAPLVVTSIQSLLQPVPSRQALEAGSRLLTVGATLDLDAFLRWLLEQHFHQTNAVELPGEFSRRGGLLDLFAPDWERPVRVELFGDEIVSLRRFEISTQRSLAKLDQVEVTVLDPAVRADGHLADYLPPDSWHLLLEAERAEEHGRHYLERLERPEDAHSLAAVRSRFQEFPYCFAAGLTQGSSEVACRLQTESVDRFSGEVGKIREELDRLGGSHEVFLVASTEAEVQRLTDLLAETDAAREERLHFVVGQLNEGFRLAAQERLFLSANELFRRTSVRRTARRQLGKANR